MLMPDSAEALRVAKSQVVPGGPIYITQTIQNVKSPLMEWIKPRLSIVTTIDFGKVTYHSQIMELAKAAGLTVVEDEPIEGSLNKTYLTYRLFVMRDSKFVDKAAGSNKTDKPYQRK